MSDETQRALRELLATLSEDLSELDNTLFRHQNEAQVSLMLTVRRLVALHEDRLAN